MRDPGFPGLGRAGPVALLFGIVGFLFRGFARRRSNPGRVARLQAALIGRRIALQPRQLEIGRLQVTLKRMRSRKLTLMRPPRFTPFSFPLMVERLREAVSTESVGAVVQRLLGELESAADLE